VVSEVLDLLTKESNNSAPDSLTNATCLLEQRDFFIVPDFNAESQRCRGAGPNWKQAAQVARCDPEASVIPPSPLQNYVPLPSFTFGYLPTTFRIDGGILNLDWEMVTGGNR
jgi:hypothetical protein